MLQGSFFYKTVVFTSSIDQASHQKKFNFWKIFFRESIRQPDFNLFKYLAPPDLYDNAITIIKFAQMLTKVMCASGVYDFSLKVITSTFHTDICRDFCLIVVTQDLS